MKAVCGGILSFLYPSSCLGTTFGRTGWCIRSLGVSTDRWLDEWLYRYLGYIKEREAAC